MKNKKIRPNHTDRAARIASAQEQLWGEVMAGIEEGMTSQEVIFAQQSAPSVEKQMQRLRKRQARELMAIQAQNMGGVGAGFMRPLQLAGDYNTEDFTNGE